MTTLFASLLYVAVLALLFGLAYRIWTYAKTPAPLKIPTMPAPTSGSGVAFRLLREVTVFESLFKSNKWLWLFGWIFHVSLLIVLLRHLRYFSEPVWGWVALLQPFGVYAGIAMAVSLIALFLRRVVLQRIRYISNPSDYLMLLLLFVIAVSGLIMKYVSHTDIVAVKAFALGWLRFDSQPLPMDGALMIHLALVALLMIIFPISKLLHAPGLFFSPTRNQIDNAREKRHLAPWAAKAEGE